MKNIEENIVKKELINKALRKMDSLTEEEMKVLNVTQDGLPIKTEVKSEILEHKRPYKTMEKFIDIVPVKEKKGVYSKEDETKVTELTLIEDEFTPIQTADEKLKAVAWEVGKYGAITEVSNKLIEESEYNISKALLLSYERKATRTRNKVIFTVMKEDLTPATVNEAQLLSSLNDELDPSIEEQHIIVTNQTGLAKLQEFNSYKVKESDEGVKRFIDIYKVEVFSDQVLENENGQAPIFYGSFIESIKMFVYGDLEFKSTQDLDFNKDSSKFRGIEYFDVKKFTEADYQYALLS